jgi:Short C-terminal domain
LLTGCLAFQVGGDKTCCQPTVGQQLTDLKKARDTGAMTEEEYQAQRAKILGHHQ